MFLLRLFVHTLYCTGLLLCMNISRTKEPPSRPAVCSMVVLFLFCALCIGLFPINLSGDRVAYARSFLEATKATSCAISERDSLFSIYVYGCSRILDAHLWLLLTGFIYVGNYAIASYSFSKKYGFILFFMFCYGFQFFAYGVNTLRAGLACSFLLLAITQRKHLFTYATLMLVSVGLHNSMALPSLAHLASRFYTNTKIYTGLWIICIAASICMGHFFESFFASFIQDERRGYLLVNEADTHYKVGFRVDFLLYSTAPIIMALYYIIKKKFTDEIYNSLLNTYLLANSFWILCIRANYSDRFAYLSWFLCPILLVYPLTKTNLFRNQRTVLATIIFVYISFSYYMYNA